jgi:Xaa-Pro aminopeptidase
VRRLLLLLAFATSLVPASRLDAQITQAEFAARRKALLDTLSDGVVLVLGAGEPVPDFLPFHQSRPFLYLTGFTEPGASLLMVKSGSTRREFLFVRAKNPAQEVWTGKRMGAAASVEMTGIEGRDAAVLRNVLDTLLTAHRTLHVLGDLGTRMTERSHHDQFVDAVKGADNGITVSDARRILDRLRGRKSPAELERLRIAAEITARGHLASWQLLQPGVAEFELQAIAEGTWKREGGDGPAYGSIVGSGPNSTTLHYNRSDRIAEAGEVIVMDLATYFDGYAADVTRTVPVSGRFSAAQAEIYRIVLAAQKAAERQIRVGGPSRAMTDSSTAVLAAGLAELGLIESPSATYDCGTTAVPRQCSQLSLFYMHGLGHGIGLNVHDPDQYTATGKIDVGSAFTLEPGIYVRANLLEIIPPTMRNGTVKARIGPAVTRYANIGVRIEDDFLVTADGVIRASAAVPREIDEIERELAKPRLPLDTAAVSRYLRLKTGRY